MTRNIFFGLMLFLFGCTNSDSSNNSDAKHGLQDTSKSFPIKELLVDNGEEEGWGADIRFSIVSVEETDTSKMITAISTFEGEKLGVIVSMPKIKEGNKGFASGIVIKSIGIESDNFLKALAKLYKQKPDTTLKFIKAITVNYVNLDEFAKSLGAQDGGEYKVVNQYKLFFEDLTDGDIAEIYLNINEVEHWIELKEKDEEYRPTIIKFLKK